MPMKPLSIKFPEELIQMLDEEAKPQERSRPQQIRFILNKWYKAKNEETKPKK